MVVGITKKLAIVLICIVFSAYLAAIDVDSELQKIFEQINGKEWVEAKIGLEKQSLENAEINLLWALWFGGDSNPGYDKTESTKYLEVAARLGSQEAQLLLVGRYLFSSDPIYTNYFAGVELGSKLVVSFKEQIAMGKDKDGELHRIVGKFYIFGIGVEKNIDCGLEYMRKAAAMGDEEAQVIIGKQSIGSYMDTPDKSKSIGSDSIKSIGSDSIDLSPSPG